VEQHWDLNGDGAYDDGSASTAQAKLAEGKHTVGLQVKDSQGIVSTVTRDVTVAKHQVVVTPNQPPSTRISSVSPNPVHVGERVTLTASSSDPEGGPVSESWDLNGDGQFGDATGPSATTTFSSPGAPVVAVRATDAGGASAVAFETVTVLPVAGPQPGGELQWLTPFPVVRISGTAFRNYTRIRRFSVLAPAGSRVVVSCHGPCGHARRFERRLSAAATVKTVRVRSFERKFSSGAVIEVAVTRGGYVGKYTRLRIRRLDSPARTDGCMLPGRAKPARCPARP
jgi:hypothetical protein